MLDDSMLLCLKYETKINPSYSTVLFG